MNLTGNYNIGLKCTKFYKILVMNVPKKMYFTILLINFMHMSILLISICIPGMYTCMHSLYLQITRKL